MHYSYLFEAHTIQKYILDSGKVKEMVGASEILESLTGRAGPLDLLLDNLKLKNETDYEFSRRGGGAFYLLFLGENAHSNAKKLMNIWTFVVNDIAPALEFNHVIGQDAGSAEQAIKKGKDSLRELRSQPQPILPETTPLVRRSPRTGMPVVKKEYDGNAYIWLDAASLQKRKSKYARGKALSDKFLPKEMNKSPVFEFPRNLEHELEPDQGDSVFPFKNGNHTIGIIHADGNGLGEILLKLGNELETDSESDANNSDAKNYANIFSDLSEKIDQATQQAAQKALEPIKKDAQKEWDSGKDNEKDQSIILPVRPLILGGDDLTVIVRGDFALHYARDFIQYFEEETEKELKVLKKNYPTLKEHLPDKMTACAGITLLKSNQPFSLGYSLAESLCGAAKTASRKLQEKQSLPYIPASLVFHRITSSFIDDYKFSKDRELTVAFKDSDNKYSLTLGAYGVGEPVQGLPAFDDLKAIKELFQEKDMAKGPTRHFLTMMNTDPSEAKDVWMRWEKGMKNNANRKQILKKYKNNVSELFGIEEKEVGVPFNVFKKGSNDSNDDKIVQETFIGDLISWMAAEGETHAN